MLAGLLISHSAGGTFLAWSIYYLSGADRYYNASKDQLLDLPSDPLNTIEKNAHNFHPNFPLTLDEFNSFHASMIGRRDVNVLYLHEHDSFGQADINQKLNELDRLVYVDLHPNFLRYFIKFEDRVLGPRLDDPEQSYSSWQEKHDHFLETFFSSSLEKFGSIQHTWSHREFLAMNLDFNKCQIISDCYDRSQFSHYYLDNADVWMKLDQSLDDLFGYLGLAIDPTRRSQWLEVYSRWKLLHEDRINFCLYFDSMLEAIIKGMDMDLGRFNLDVVQEAALLSALMKQHGLNLKAYGLERFKNAADLHRLLEPNQHG